MGGPKGGGRVTLAAGWLIDGTGAPPRRGVAIEIEGSTLRAIGGLDAAAGLSGLRGEVLDCRDCTVIPPLVDSHVHLAFDGLHPGGAPRSAAAAEERMRQNAARLLRRGVLAVRDAGDAAGYGLRFARRAGEGGSRLHVLSTGPALHRPGRYGALLGRALPAGCQPADALEGEGGMRGAVKIVNSGLNSLVAFGRETAPQFGAEELAALVRRAAAQGLSVLVHANGREPVARAVRAGVRSIEHGFFMGRENLAAMAEAGIAWVPTLAPIRAMAERPEADPRERDVARRTLDHQREQLCQARGLGVKVALGTDAGSPGVEHGDAAVEELRLLIASGYPVAEAVAAATSAGAELSGFGGGRLRPGAEASLLVLEGGPADIPESLRRIRRVFLAGEELPLPA